MSALDLVNQIVSPQDLRNVLRQTPAYNKNRDRVGALVHDGLAAYDRYQLAKPYIFWASVVGALASGYAYYKRRNAGPEAKILYAASFLLCSGTAYITRPAMGAEAQADAQAEQAAPASGQPPVKGSGGLIRWLDKRVETLKEQDPRFADAALQRAVSMPGFREEFQQLPPLIQATVV